METSTEGRQIVPKSDFLSGLVSLLAALMAVHSLKQKKLDHSSFPVAAKIKVGPLKAADNLN